MLEESSRCWWAVGLAGWGAPEEKSTTRIAQLDVNEQQRRARSLQKFTPDAAEAIVAASMTLLLTGGDHQPRQEHFDSRRPTREA